MHGSSTGAGHAVEVSGGVGSGVGQPVPVLLVVVAPPPVELPGVGVEHAIIQNSGVATATVNENVNLLIVYPLPSSESLFIGRYPARAGDPPPRLLPRTGNVIAGDVPPLLRPVQMMLASCSAEGDAVTVDFMNETSCARGAPRWTCRVVRAWSWSGPGIADLARGRRPARHPARLSRRSCRGRRNRQRDHRRRCAPARDRRVRTRRRHRFLRRCGTAIDPPDEEQARQAGDGERDPE